MISFGNNEIISIFYGTEEVSTVLGCDGAVVWQKQAPTPPTPEPPTPEPIEGQFKTIAQRDGTISFSGSSATNLLSYSVNGGEWTQMTEQSIAVPVTAGDVVYWNGNAVANSNGIGKFFATAQNIPAEYQVAGNIMSLVSGDSYDEATTVVNSQFAGLFNQSWVTSAENLVLPATTLADYCYMHMFEGCGSLIKAPSLPATTLAHGCYEGMFSDCSSLTTAPQLPATTLASDCYLGMFDGCSSLATAPQLPATTLAYNCYSEMFHGCTNLTEAPELPAETLVSSCYARMFDGCESLSAITCLATDLSAYNCLGQDDGEGWVNGVAAEGTFTKAASVSWPTGISGIPADWTVISQ